MAHTLAAFSTLHSISQSNSFRIPSHSLSLPIRNLHFQFHVFANSFKHLTLKKDNSFSHGIRKLRLVEEETQIPEKEEEEQQQQQPTQPEEAKVQEGAEPQTMSVPVSPSGTLTMFFQAEGTINETVIPTVTKALEETDGIMDLKVQVLEGIASVELTKQTTVQATGVASSLVEVVQGSGFKLQSLNLSFMDEEDALV